MEQQKTPGQAFSSALNAFIEWASDLRDHLWDEVTDRRHPYWPPTWLKVAVSVVAAAVVCFLVIPLLAALGAAVWGWSGKRVRWLAAWDLTKVVTNPVRVYLTHHAVGLPANANVLWLAWLITGAVLLAFSLFGATGARVGWALYGVGTAAMVWAQTPALNRGLAVGITAAWWSVLSLLAYRRRAAPPSVVAIPQQTGAGHAAAAPGTTRVFCDDLEAVLYVLEDVAKVLDLAASDATRRERIDPGPAQLTTRANELRSLRTQLRRTDNAVDGRPDNARDWYSDLCWYLNNVPLLDAAENRH